MVFRGVFQRVRLYQGRVPGCAWVGERLGALASRDVLESECRAIEAHLKECPRCAGDWEVTRGVCDWLAGGFLSARGVTSCCEERVSRIMGRIESYEAEKAWKVTLLDLRARNVAPQIHTDSVGGGFGAGAKP